MGKTISSPVQTVVGKLPGRVVCTALTPHTSSEYRLYRTQLSLYYPAFLLPFSERGLEATSQRMAMLVGPSTVYK